MGDERAVSNVSSTGRTKLAVRIDSRPGNDTIRLFVNPGVTEPETADATLTGLDLGVFNQISIGAGFGGEPDTAVHAAIDRIRIGREFAETSPSD